MKSLHLAASLVISGSVVFLAGCGGGDEQTSAPLPMPEEIAEAASAEEPAPQEAPQFQIPAAQPGEEPTAQEVEQYQSAQQYLQQGAQKILEETKTAPAPTTERERFDRNMKWIVVLKDGNAQQKAEVRNQIREAGLSRDEAMELERLFRTYGVRP